MTIGYDDVKVAALREKNRLISTSHPGSRFVRPGMTAGATSGVG